MFGVSFANAYVPDNAVIPIAYAAAARHSRPVTRDSPVPTPTTTLDRRSRPVSCGRTPRPRPRGLTRRTLPGPAAAGGSRRATTRRGRTPRTRPTPVSYTHLTLPT